MAQFSLKGVLQDLQLSSASNAIKLKRVVTKGGEANINLILATEPKSGDEDITRDYFFQSSVDEWYNQLKHCTFRSSFVPILSSECRDIINYWKITGSKIEPDKLSAIDVPSSLQDLVNRIDSCILDNYSEGRGVFVKLSTRSPKDSKTIFRKAQEAFAEVLQSRAVQGLPSASENDRLVLFSDEMVKAAVCKTGVEAVTILLDSQRVAEDLMYALEDGKKEYSLSLVVRAWDSRITPKCEFRGFVWNRNLNCIGQYWHSLYFPDFADPALLAQVSKDCLTLFEELKDSLPVPNAMLDLAWLGPGNVILIEVNPLMEGLGSFKGSTGLFDYYADEPVLTGKAPFEIRVRTEPESKAEIISHMSMEWRKVIYGF